MSKDKRLDRLYPGLSAKERGLLMLRDYKAGEPQDPQLRWTTPDSQAQAFNRYVDLINAANGDLSSLILVLRERAVQETLRMGWLMWAHMSAMELWAARAAFNISAREPITESEYDVKEQEAGRELIPIAECAMLYTEYHHEWDDADYEVDDEGNRWPTDEAWDRVHDATLAKLRKLAEQGKLVSKGKGKRLKIEAGAFYDWIGEPVLVAPELGIGFDIRPDHRQPEVERQRREYAFIGQLLDRGACKLDLPLDMESPIQVEVGAHFDVEMARTVAATLRAGVRENWLELRAIEEQLGALSAEFDGEDVLHPSVRERLEDAKARLREVHKGVQRYTGPFELPEPDEETRALVKRIVEREMT